MGKYSIGVRVRDPDGDIGEIIGKPAKGVREIRYEGGKLDGMTIEWGKGELEVVEGVIIDARWENCGAADAWQLKVGDRVKCVKDYPGTFTSGAVYEVAYYAVGDFARIGVAQADHGEPDGVLASYFDPFTLEAGKSYRTRDGRKVLVKDNNSSDDLVYPFFHDSGRDGFHGLTGDGKSCIRDDDADIVAEWVEPVEPEATLRIGDIVYYHDDLTRGRGKILSAALLYYEVAVEPRDEEYAYVVVDGRPCRKFARHSLSRCPPPSVGAKVTITTTGTVTGIAGNDNVNVVLDGLPPGADSFAFPPAILTAA